MTGDLDHEWNAEDIETDARGTDRRALLLDEIRRLTALQQQKNRESREQPTTAELADIAHADRMERAREQEEREQALF